MIICHGGCALSQLLFTLVITRHWKDDIRVVLATKVMDVFGRRIVATELVIISVKDTFFKFYRGRVQCEVACERKVGNEEPVKFAHRHLSSKAEGSKVQGSTLTKLLARTTIPYTDSVSAPEDLEMNQSGKMCQTNWADATTKQTID